MQFKAKTILGIMIVVLLLLVGVSILGKKNKKPPGTRVIPISTPVISPTIIVPNQKSSGKLPSYPFEYEGLVLELNSTGTILKVDYSGDRIEAENKVDRLLNEYGVDKEKLKIVFIGLQKDSSEPFPGFSQ